MRTIGSEGDRTQSGMGTPGDDAFGAGRDRLAQGRAAGTKARDGRNGSPAIDPSRRASFEASLKRRETDGEMRREAASGIAHGEAASGGGLEDAARSAALAGASAFQHGAGYQAATPGETDAGDAATFGRQDRVAAIVDRVERIVREELFVRAGDRVSLTIPMDGLSDTFGAIRVSVVPGAVEVGIAFAAEATEAARREAMQGLLAQLQARFAGRRVQVAELSDGVAGPVEAERTGGNFSLHDLFRQAGGGA